MHLRLGGIVAICLALGGCATAASKPAPAWIPTCCIPEPDPGAVDYYVDPVGMRSSVSDHVPGGTNVRVVLVNVNPVIYDYTLEVDTATRRDVEASDVLRFLFRGELDPRKMQGLIGLLPNAQTDSLIPDACVLPSSVAATVGEAILLVEGVDAEAGILRAFASRIAVVNEPGADADRVWEAARQGAEEAGRALSARDRIVGALADVRAARESLSKLAPFDRACRAHQQVVEEVLLNLDAAIGIIQELADPARTADLRNSSKILQALAQDPTRLYRVKYAPPHSGRHDVRVVVSRARRQGETVGEQHEILQRRIAVDRSPFAMGVGFTIGIQPRYTYIAAKRSGFDPVSGEVEERTVVVREGADDFRVVPTVNLLYAPRPVRFRPNLNLGIGVDPADGKPTLEFALGVALEPMPDLNVGVGLLTGTTARLADGLFVGDPVAEGTAVSRKVNTVGFAVSLIYRVR